jgi:hypothetical protein
MKQESMNFRQLIFKNSIVISLTFIILLTSISDTSSLNAEAEDTGDKHIILFPPDDVDTTYPAVQESKDVRAEIIPEIFNFDLNISYAIIAPEMFYDQLVPFADWKTRKGVGAHIFIMEDIEKNYRGISTQDKIHSFLRELKNYKPAAEWLLLVGDADVIPVPQIRADINGSDVWWELQDFAYSDYFYAGLDSSWDQDGNGIYGEVIQDYDWTPELYVGRLPVGSEEELDTVLKKLNNYEKQPPQDSWYNRAILVGAVMDLTHGPNVPDNLSTQEDDGYNDYKDNALEVNQKAKKHFPSIYSFDEFYDYYKLEPGGYSQSTDNLNHANVVESFNKGAGIVNFVSHGYENGDGHVEYAGDGDSVIWTPLFEDTDAFKSTNDGMLPLFYSSSCTSGNFTEEDDSGLEQLLTAPNGGAVGFIGATVTTYRGEFRANDTSFGNWWLNDNFWQMFFAGDHKPARVLYNLKVAYGNRVLDPSNPYKDDIDFQQMFRVNKLAYNYLGDPELSIWTKQPEQLLVEFEDNFQPAYWNAPYEVTVKNQNSGEPVENARVAITGTGQFGWIETDSSGQARFAINTVPGIRYNLTVTADNYLPFEGEFTVSAELNLQLTNDNISVDKMKLKIGADTNITIQFKNTGGIAAPEVDLILYDGPPGINNNITPVYSFENVQPNDVRYISIRWTMPGGNHNIYVVIDPANKLMEWNENDNSAWVTIRENQPPVLFKLPVIPLKEDEILMDALLISSYAWDQDPQDTLSFRILHNAEPSCEVVIDENNYIDIIPEKDWYGNCNVTIEVTDGTDYALLYLLIEVSAVNDPPLLKPIQNQSMLEDHWFEMVLFGYDNSDPGDKIFFETDLFDVFPELQDNLTVVFEPATGVLKIRAGNSMVGEHNVNFRAVDEDGGKSEWQTVKFDIINVLDAPVIRMEEQYTAKVGEAFKLDVVVYNEDKNATMLFSDNSDLFEIDPSTGIIEFTPDYDDVGTHTITITIFYGNITVTDSFKLVIENGMDQYLQMLIIASVVIALGLGLGGVLIFMYMRRQRVVQKHDKVSDEGDDDDDAEIEADDDIEEEDDETESEASGERKEEKREVKASERGKRKIERRKHRREERGKTRGESIGERKEEE